MNLTESLDLSDLQFVQLQNGQDDPDRLLAGKDSCLANCHISEPAGLLEMG